MIIAKDGKWRKLTTERTDTGAILITEEIPGQVDKVVVCIEELQKIADRFLPKPKKEAE